MDFSEALTKAKNGHRIRRETWSEGSYVVVQPGHPEGVPLDATTAAATGEAQGTVRVFDPYLLAWNGRSQTFSTWMPTDHDLFVGDWTAAPVPQANVSE